jgi:PAS domain S-box-containing protein
MVDRGNGAASGEAVSDLMRHLTAVKREAQQAISAPWEAAADGDLDLAALLHDTQALLGTLLHQVSSALSAGREAEQREDLETAFKELQVAEEELRVQNEELAAARDAIESERRRYQELFEFAPDGSLVTDFRGIVQEANRAAATLLGVDSSSLIGQPLWLYLAEDERRGLITQLQCLQQDDAGDSLRWEMTIPTRQGASFEASVALAPVYDDRGKRVGLRWLIRDVTERKRTEEALRESEERYRGLFNTMSEGFALHEIVCDVEGRPTDYRFLAVNPAFEALTGLKGEGVQGKTVLEVLPTVEPFWIEAYGQVALTGKPARFEHRAVPLGRTYEVMAYSPGERQFATLFRDVTEQRQAEEMLRQQAEEMQRWTESLEQRVEERTAELVCAYAGLQVEIEERKRAEETAEAERQRFNDILEILPAYVVLLTPDYHVSVANRFFRERFGEAGVLRCHEYLFGLDQPCETCETYTVLKTGDPHHWEWIGPDGRTYDVFDFPFTDLDGTTLILEMGIDITKRVQAERALQEANEMLERRVAERTAQLTLANAELAATRDFLENLLSYANAPIVVWDPALRITRFNTAFERLTGLAACSVVGQTLDILFPEERKEEAMVQIQRTTTGERWEVVEIPILHQDGTVHTVLWNSATIYEADGTTPLATIAQGQDISERKRAEEELRQREEQLRIITDSVPVLIGFVDREQRYRFANQQYKAWFGRPWQQVIGQRVRDIIGDEAAAILRPYTQRALAGEAVRFAQWVPYQGAGLRYVDSAYVPSLDAEGQVQGYYVLVSDNTERQEAAQERERLLAEVRQARDELERRVEERTAQLVGTNEVLQAEIAVRRQVEDERRESELRFRQLAENIDEAFWLLEPESGRFLYVNPVWQKLWDRAGGQVADWPALFEAAAHPEDRQRVIAAWQTDGARFDEEFRVLRAGGEVRWVRGRAFPVQDSEGQSMRVAGIIQDITAEKAAQAAVIQAERLSTAGRLAASLGHEINNPLQSAIGCLDLAREAIEEGRDPARFLQVSCDALERAAWVVSQLRSLHRDAPQEERKPVRLHELLHNVLLLSRKQCASQGIQVIEQFGDEIPAMPLMPNALQQVFLNLVLNAIDAMPEGGELRISVEPSTRPDGMWVHFSDTGGGLSLEAREHLFEPFHTTKSEGLGLGLFISQNVVQQHGGRIEARPGEAGGTVFSVFLPRN